MRRRATALAAVALVGAQAGHLVAYQLRFGPTAIAIQSSGAHAYFPAFVKAALGASALVALASLVLIAAARLLAQGRAARHAGPSYASLLAVLFTLQLAWFTSQEVVEALASGQQPDSAANLLLWGMVGQLPVAAAGAVALRWFWTRVDAAGRSLASIVTSALAFGAARAPVLIPVYAYPERALALVHASRRDRVKRGPPCSSSTSNF